MHGLHGGVVIGVKWLCVDIMSPASLEQTPKKGRVSVII